MALEMPETRYARSGDVNIAYQVFGEGEVPLVWVPGFTQHIELSWEEPNRHAWFEGLGRFARVLVLDKRGTGLSDRVEGSPPLEVRMDDIRAVLDALGSTARQWSSPGTRARWGSCSRLAMPSEPSD